MIGKLNFEHWIVIFGFALAILFVLSANNVLPPSAITSILSSKYCLLISCTLVALGYYISKIETENKYRASDDIAPGLGEKKHIVSTRQVDTDFTDLGGSGGGD